MTYLGDVNFWFALAVEAHPHHRAAHRWISGVDGPVCLCRIAQLSFLRMLTTAPAMYDSPLHPREAWDVYITLRRHPGIEWSEMESERIETIWAPLLMGWTSASHWVDSYLAAFAISGGYTMVTFDKGFSKYRGLRYVTPA